MAAEPVGTAYVIIRALTSQLSKDIKDGLDKGSKDADSEAAGREIGRSVGEGAGDEFEDTWNERSSEAISDSADSRETKKAQKDYSDRFFTRFSDHFGAGGEQMSERFRSAFSDSADDGDLFGGIDVDRAAGSFGSDLADEQGSDYDVAWKRNVQHTLNTTANDDGVNKGLSKVALNMGESIGNGAAEGAAKAIGKGFPDAMSNALGALSVPGGPLVAIGAQIGVVAAGPALQVIGAIAGEAVAVLGFLGTAAAGAGVAFAGIAAAAVPAFLGIKAAFGAESDELDAFNDHLEDFNEQWQIFGFSVQENLLPHLHTALDALEELIPVFSHYGETLGEVAGVQAQAFAEMLTSHGNKERIRSILDQGLPIITSLGGALTGLITPILQILNAAMPIAQQLADAIGRVVDSFAKWVDMKSKSGELTATFQKWYDRFVLIMGILGDLGSVLADVFGIGADSSDSMFESLKKITEKWKEWTNSADGQNKIAKFFESAKAIAGEVFGLIGDIIGLIVGPMTAGAGEGTGTNSIVNFFKTVREEWLPAFVEFAGKAKEALKGPIGDLFKTLTTFIKTLAANPKVLAGIFGVIFSNFFLIVGLIKGVIVVLNSGIGKFLVPIGLWVVFALKIMNTLKILRPVLSFLGTLFAPIINSVKAFAASMRAAAISLLSNPITIAIVLIVAALTLLYFHFKPFRQFVDRFIIDPLQRLWTAIGGFKGILDFFKSLPEQMGRFIKAMPAIGANIFNFFKNLPTSVPALFSNIKEAITGFLSDDPFGKIALKLREFGELLVEKLGNVPVAGAIARFLQKLLGGFANLADFFKTFDFGSAAKGFTDFIKSIFAGDLDFSQVADKIRETLGKVFGVLSDAFKDVPVLGSVFETLQGLFTDFDGTIQQIKGRILAFLDDLIAKFGDLPFIGSALKLLKVAFTDFGAALDLLGKIPVLGSIINFFRNIESFSPGDVLGKVTDALGNFFDTLKGFASTIGTALMDALHFIAPILGEIFTFIGNALLTAFNFIAPRIAALLQIVGPILGRFAITVGTAIINGLKRAGELLGDAVGFLLDKIIEILPKLGTLLGKGLGKAFKFAFNILGKILPVILRNLGKILLGIVAFVFGPMILAIGAFFLTLGPALLAIFRRLPALLGAALSAFVNFISSFLEESGIADKAKELFPKVIDAIVEFFKALPGRILDALQAIGPPLLAFGAQLAQWIWEGLQALGGLLADIGGKFLEWFNANKGTIGQIGLNIVQWIGEKLLDLGSWILDMITAFGTFLLEHKTEIGQFGIDMLEWIFEKLKDVGAQLFEWLGAFGGWLADHKDEIGRWGLNMLSWIFEKLKDLGGQLFEWLGAFGGWLNDHKDEIGRWGLNMLTWIFEKLKDLGGQLFEWLGAFGGWLNDHKDEVGRWGLNMLTWIFEKLKDLGGQLFEWLGAFGGWLNEHKGEIVRWGLNILGWIFESLLDIGSKLLEWLGAFGGWLATNGLPWAGKLGLDILGWIFDGLIDVGEHLLIWLGELGGWMRDTGAPALLQLGVNILGWIFDGLIDVGSKALEWLGALQDWMGTTGLSALGELGGSILNGIFDSLSDIGKLGLKLAQFVGRMAQWALTEGPSLLADFAWNLAKGIWDGVWDYFTDNPITHAIFGDSEGTDNPFQPFLVGMLGAPLEVDSTVFSQRINEILHDSFGGVQVDAADMALIWDKVQAGISDGSVATGADIEHIIEEVLGTSLTEAETPAGWANLYGTKMANDLVNVDWSKHGKVVSDGVKTAVNNEISRGDPVVLPPLPNLEDDQGVVSAWASDSSGTIVKQLTDKLGATKPAQFVKSVKSVTKSLGDKLGDQDKQMVAPTNRLVDKVLLTLARLVKEVEPKVLNPFILEMVTGINTAATQATAAMNKLVDRVMLTLARLIVETPRTMSTFALAVALGMSTASSAAIRTAGTLVNGVVAVLGTLAGRVGSVLAPAGVAAANGLNNGFKSGLQSFINTLQSLDILIALAVGNLNNVLFQAGVQLINGLILGMASRIDDLRVEVGIARGLATSILANGGIINQPTLALMGEAGAEAVIPLTRPTQALRVMRQSGLDQLVMNSTGTPSATSAPDPFANATSASILTIEHADIFDKVDVDIIAARMKSAYKSLPGR